ncbi:MAG: ExbD/TolR family protein [Polyangia bacterium]|jgi:biopolymer transport protein ExbD
MAGGASYEDDDGGGMIADINVTPLVDITLVLLIVFMIVVPSIVNNPSIKVELPKAATGDDTLKSTLALTLQRKAEGGYTLYANGEATDESKVRTLIPALLTKNKDLQAIIAADKGISYGDVVHIVDLVKQLGVHKFALNTDAAQ